MEIEQRLLTIEQFTFDVLRSQAPTYETASEVLDYLTSEANVFVERVIALKALKTQRQELLSTLAGEVNRLSRVLAACGIRPADTKYVVLEDVCCFTNATEPPNIAGLFVNAIKQVEKLQGLERLYHDLLRRHTSITETIDMVSACRIEVPQSVRDRILDETRRRQAASKTLQDREDSAMPSSSFRPPKPDIRTVMDKAEKMELLIDQLQQQEERLHSYRALPLDLESVLLENDQMQRRLQVLHQQRSDLFRSVR